MYSIYIDNLKIFAYHGVYDFEKEKGQEFRLSIKCDIDSKLSRDNIEDTVDYAELLKFSESFAKENRFDLIEFLADKLSYAILKKYPQICNVLVRISKPDAPIDADFEDVGVTVERKRHTAYLSLGTNIGEKKKNLLEAISAIDETDDCKVESISKMYLTSPVGFLEQDYFLNCAVKISTLIEPMALLRSMQKIENKMGRIRSFKNAPRIIDIDIMLYDDVVSLDETLIIPHPSMFDRKFMLVPLLDIYDTSIDFKIMLTKTLASLHNDDTTELYKD